MLILKIKVKAAIKRIFPRYIRNIIVNHRFERRYKEYKNLSNKEIFSKVYRDGLWNRSMKVDEPFNSGSGSRNELIVDPYVKAVSEYLLRKNRKPNVVDLGCGDFCVGTRLRNYFNNYIACDIVSELIDHNQKRYATLDVDFRVLDLVEDDLPEGDVLIIREVLQHLGNDDIIKVVNKLRSWPGVIIITESLPLLEFIPNIEKPVGPETRLRIDSGVVLTEHPFNLPVSVAETLCEVRTSRQIIRTNSYEV